METGTGSAGLRARLQDALGAAYTLERELGGGGMSRVFVAEDARLGRRVVVKVLAPDLAAGLSPERFEREIHLAARLQHPNVVPVLAAGERDGLAYYTMPYVEGESLRARIARDGRLSVEAAVAVLRDVARALEYAHAHGVVHRDVKPDNILLAGSAAAVADFGIAKALHAARTAGAADPAPETLTRVGTSLGTPAYMAPEQAAGDPDVDARADLYAWGVVAYELLAGEPPFAGRAAHQLVAAHIGEPPPPLAARTPNAPPDLVALVMRCLEKEPTRRPQWAGAVLAALEQAHARSGEQVVPAAWTPRPAMRAAAGTVVALVLVAGLAAVANRTRASAPPVRPVLAVLPFENLGPAADAYFADGLTSEVRGRLAGLSGLSVIGGNSAQQYRGSTKRPREIASELGATHLLTGSVRWERTGDGGGRVRVNPELVRASDEASVWAEPVEGPLGELFAMQTSVSERVAAALDVALVRRGAAAQAPPAPTRSPAAYDAYLRGLAHAAYPNRHSTPSRRAAVAAFERAVALDPQFAAAHARAAMAYLEVLTFGSDSGLLGRARASVARALALDSTLLEAQLARGMVLAAGGDQHGAHRALQAAARIAPSNAEVATLAGRVLVEHERYEDAVVTFEHAALLEPLAAAPAGHLAGTYDALSRYEDAIRSRARELALAPHVSLAYLFQASSYLLARADTAAARQTLARGEPGPTVDLLTRLPLSFAGRAIWLRVVPAAVLTAKDTLTLAGYLRDDWGTPELFHLMKARHFALTDRPARANAYADSIIARLEPVLGNGLGTSTFVGAFSQRAALAEAYAYAGRPADAARVIDAYIADTRAGRGVTGVAGPKYALVIAAYIDVLIGRRDLAAARLEEALRLPSGQWISRALLRADPSWAPLRGHPGFERLIAGS